MFQAAFAINLSAFAVLKVHGRPVCSTDMGHFKHDFFDGLNCTGNGKYTACQNIVETI